MWYKITNKNQSKPGRQQNKYKKSSFKHKNFQTITILEKFKNKTADIERTERMSTVEICVNDWSRAFIFHYDFYYDTIPWLSNRSILTTYI